MSVFPKSTAIVLVSTLNCSSARDKNSLATVPKEAETDKLHQINGYIKSNICDCWEWLGSFILVDYNKHHKCSKNRLFLLWSNFRAFLKSGQCQRRAEEGAVHQQTTWVVFLHPSASCLIACCNYYLLYLFSRWMIKGGGTLVNFRCWKPPRSTSRIESQN